MKVYVNTISKWIYSNLNRGFLPPTIPLSNPTGFMAQLQQIPVSLGALNAISAWCAVGMCPRASCPSPSFGASSSVHCVCLPPPPLLRLRWPFRSPAFFILFFPLSSSSSHHHHPSSSSIRFAPPPPFHSPPPSPVFCAYIDPLRPPPPMLGMNSLFLLLCGPHPYLLIFGIWAAVFFLRSVFPP